jgi:DNA-binding transcriptional ArsR family regulator
VRALTTEELLARLTAVGHPLRLRIIAELAGGRVHVSELARRLGMSRPLLYMHLDKLEKADMVTGHLELSDDGKAMKYIELAPFEFRIDVQTVIDALAEDNAPAEGKQRAPLPPAGRGLGGAGRGDQGVTGGRARVQHRASGAGPGSQSGFAQDGQVAAEPAE